MPAARESGHPEVVTGIFALNADGKVLLVTAPKFEDWVVPGGHVELGERLEDCAKRELLEETGLEAGELTLLGINDDTRKMIRGKPRHFVFVDYACTVGSQEVKLGEELTQYKWVGLRQAANDPSVSATVRELLPKLFSKKSRIQNFSENQK